MDILYIEMKALHMMNKLHIFPPRLRLISLDFWVDTLLLKLCNLYLFNNLDLGKRSLAPLPLKLDPKSSLYKNWV